MDSFQARAIIPLTLGTCLVLTVGCWTHHQKIDDLGPPPLGSQVTRIYQVHQENAEAAKNTIPMHEFELNRQGGQRGWRLNDFGEDHVKQIAVNLKRGHRFPVVVERSRTSIKPGSTFKYPVHFNDSLDESRRQIVVAALSAMGVAEADKLVIVAPSAAEGYSGQEAANAYDGAIGNSGVGSN